MPAASQVHRPVVRKDLALDDLVVDPSFRLYLVDVPPAELGADRSAAGALLDALAEQMALTGRAGRRPAVAAGAARRRSRRRAGDASPSPCTNGDGLR